jgi:hypothetical protein
LQFWSRPTELGTWAVSNHRHADFQSQAQLLSPPARGRGFFNFGSGGRIFDLFAAHSAFAKGMNEPQAMPASVGHAA